LAKTLMPVPLKLAFGLALVAFPLLEIGLLIRAARTIGFWWVCLIVLATAVAGSIVIQREGLKTFARTMARIEVGRGALEPMLQGFLKIVAGMLLIFPGLISDAAGLLLLIPVVRNAAAAALPRIFSASIVSSSFKKASEHPKDAAAQDHGDGITIEGEYERLDEADVPPKKAPRTNRQR
jgi:UPF0716 protein FxsA